MAIDQEIQSKVDAYRGNPQQLMQRYQQNQQLVDLLALQKLKSEKEAAARDMQLQMQQQPQTIKQQREAELLNMTKQEMMQQTQGVLQQRQAQQQQNLQQVAQQGLGALANQRPAAPQGAPQGQLMPRMAQGGIVSFQPGGSVGGRITFDQWRRMSRGERQRAGLPVSEIGGQMYFNRFGVGLGLNDPQTGERIQREPSPDSGGRNQGGLNSMGGLYGVSQEEIDAYRALRRGQGSRTVRAMSDEEIARRIAAERGPGTVPMTPGQARRAARTGAQPDISDIGRPAGVPEDYEPGTIAQFGPQGARPQPLPEGVSLRGLDQPPRGAMSMMGQGPMSTTAAMQPARGGVAALLGEQAQPQMSVPEGGIPTVTEQPPAEPTFAEQAQGITDNMRTSIPRDGMGIGGGGADAAMQRGFATADAYTGRAEKAGRYADMEAELRALDAEQYDPRQERRDQLLAFLAGTANTTNFGSTMAGGTLASLNMREKQKAGRRERLKDIFDMAERGMTLDSTLASGGLELGRTMYSEAMQNQRTALTATSNMDIAELQAEVRRGELEYNRLKDDRTFGLQERELEIEEVRNGVLGRQADAENSTRALTAALNGLQIVQEQELAVYKRVANNSQLPALQEQLLFATRDADRSRIQSEIAAEEARVAVRAEKAFDEMNGVEVRDMLAARVLELTGIGATMLSMEDIAGTKKLGGE